MKIRLFVAFTLMCFALSPRMQAVSPDGCYPAFTTAEGCNALGGLTSGQGNTGIGWYALFSAGASNFNTGVGGGALALNTGDSNTAVGAGALLLNTSGGANTAVGTDALVLNTVGGFNNALGYFALFNNSTGNFNNAYGHEALNANFNGNENEAFGDQALLGNVSGAGNVAIGDSALINSTGDGNVAVGKSAGHGLSSASNVIAIGANITGVDTVLGEVNNSCYISNIYNANVPASSSPQLVFVDPDGKFGTNVVDENGNKFQIPVSALQGFMRQGVQAVPQHQASLTPAKQARLERRVEELQSTVMRQQKQIEALTAGLQKVSAQLELIKPAPQTVLNNQ